MNILVTGGAGYIGSHACKALAARGFVPVTYDNLSRGNEWAVKWGPFELGDIGDSRRIIEVLEKYSPAALMHFAAYAYVGESVESPLLYYQNNFSGTAALLGAIMRLRPIPVVFSSSCASYGIPQHVPIAEDHPQLPINPYGHSKLFSERLLMDLNAAHGLPWIALRYFNVAGADPDGEIGEDHRPETHLIPQVIMAADSRKPIKIFGDDYPTPDGTCVRDFIHVSDVAEAHVRALTHLLKGNGSCAINLANARGFSVKEVIDAAERICGTKIPSEIAARRPGDPPILIGDASRALAMLEWKPVRSDLELLISDAWNWMKNRKKVDLNDLSKGCRKPTSN